MRAGSLIELSAWILGIALLGTYAAARVSFESARVAGIAAYREPSAAPAPPGKAAADASQTTPAAIDIDQSLWSEQRIKAFADTDPDTGRIEGLLRIPALRLEVPVYSGTTDLNLNRGAGHIEGTARYSDAGNIGIAAHRDGFFRKLKDIAIDDELELDVGGRTFRYRVVDLAVVSPQAVEVLAPTDIPSITLVTCFPFYFIGTAPQRYIVRAARTDWPADGRSPPDFATASKTDNLHASNKRNEL
jgi:sortase A